MWLKKLQAAGVEGRGGQVKLGNLPSEVMVDPAKLDEMNGVQRPLGWRAPLPDSQTPLGAEC